MRRNAHVILAESGRVLLALSFTLLLTSSASHADVSDPRETVKRETPQHKLESIETPGETTNDDTLLDIRGERSNSARVPITVDSPRTIADVLKRLGPLREVPSADYCSLFTDEPEEGEQPPRRFTRDDHGSIIWAYVRSQLVVIPDH